MRVATDFVLMILNIYQVFSVYIRTPPSNVSVMIGEDAFFVCEVGEQERWQYVVWEKISKDSITEIVAYNNQTVNYTKYEVTGTYKLSIFHTNLEDEALYECQTDGKKANAALSVSVPMDSMTITWNAQTPLNYDSEVELICRSYHSRPPAELSWYWGNHDFSRDAHYCYKLYNADGFGDSVSVLRVSMMNHRNSEIPFRCVASLPANDRVRTEYAFLPITSISDATIERISSLQFIIYNIIFFTTLDIVT